MKHLILLLTILLIPSCNEKEPSEESSILTKSELNDLLSHYKNLTDVNVKDRRVLVKNDKIRGRIVNVNFITVAKDTEQLNATNLEEIRMLMKVGFISDKRAFDEDISISFNRRNGNIHKLALSSKEIFNTYKSASTFIDGAIFYTLTLKDLFEADSGLYISYKGSKELLLSKAECQFVISTIRKQFNSYKQKYAKSSPSRPFKGGASMNIRF